MRLILIALLILTASVSACNRIYLPSPTQPTDSYYSNTVQYGQNRIEFRVSGTATGVKIRFDNSLDGLVQFSTTLPYVVSFNNSRDAIFLSLEVTPTGYLSSSPFLSAQIFVNGVLFREASSNDYSLSTLFVSGTFRR